MASTKMNPVRDLKLARVAKRNGARNSLRTIREARRNGIPISWALALIEQESAWNNIFGADRGGPFPHQKVTNPKVDALLRHTAAGGVSNGVGYTQLTSPSYIRRAHGKRGGAASVRNQISVGLEVFREKTGGDMDQAWRYNGNPSYQHQVEARAKRWHAIFKKAGLA